MNDLQSKNDYRQLFEEALEQINAAKIKAARKMTQTAIELYFNIGRLITEKQKKFGWGNSVVEELAKDLGKATGGVNSFSERNLWFMKQLYVEYRNYPELHKDVFGIPWGQNILILQRIKEYKAREYYLKATSQFGWSRDVLLNQIKAKAYENHLAYPKQHNFEKALPAHLAEQADSAMKSVYNLELLGINKPIYERKMEKLMIEKVKDLIMELGYGFCFIGNQFKLKGNTKDYYVDLLFYHRSLKSLVVFEIKTGEFKPEYAGKINFYLNLLDEQVKMKDENPSIGIILCAEKDNFEVEYSLKTVSKPIGVAEYRLTKELPENLRGKLPTARELKEKISKKLGNDFQ
jgi:predicted nuclease of restriction endonuclease-like (RecB) superfamily